MPIALLQATLPPDNLPFLFAAFAVTWIAFFAYAFFVSRRQQELRKEIAELRGTLDQQGSEDAG
ncbi:uncharacterized protein METZ01_LOCUS281702 [marine metagenome]|uniref:CcmD family protein n=1 Tax=marine metagenome TaxID=408172 RepID=A0A382KW36_9ZZZZ